MANIKLSNRLQTIASFVEKGAKVADIGTDHGYIPVWLAQNSIASKIAAADINYGPLEHAKRTATEYDVFDKITFRLCSGLSFPESVEYDTIIIAGMGGELIQSILIDAPWTKTETKLILQPNTKIQDLMEWLLKNGYSVDDVKLVKDAGKYYQILIVRGGESHLIAKESDRLIHPLYFKKRDTLLYEYISHLLNRYYHAINGMRAAKSEHEELHQMQKLISELETMKEEVETWQL